MTAENNRLAIDLTIKAMEYDLLAFPDAGDYESTEEYNAACADAVNAFFLKVRSAIESNACS